AKSTTSTPSPSRRSIGSRATRASTGAGRSASPTATRSWPTCSRRSRSADNPASPAATGWTRTPRRTGDENPNDGRRPGARGHRQADRRGDARARLRAGEPHALGVHRLGGGPGTTHEEIDLEVEGDTDDEKAQSLVRAMLAAGLAEKL